MENLDLDPNVIASIGEAIDGASSALSRLFPGLMYRSRANAERKITKTALKSVREIRAIAEKEGLSPEIVESFCRDSVSRITRNENLDQVVFFAESMVNKEAKVDDLVGSEWLNYFVDHAERVSDEEAQRAWASVLAGEVNQRGSYSKNAMKILSLMEAKDAKSFERICEFIAFGAFGEVLAMNHDDVGAAYNAGSLSYTELSDLGALGLIDMGGMRQLEIKSSEWILVAEDKGRFAFIRQPEGNENRLFFKPILTSAGMALSKLCTKRDFPGIVKALKLEAERKGLEVTVTDDAGCAIGPEAVTE